MDITIAGSGTAGLLSGLMLKSAFPNFNIKIISSSKIGIIGVGEGSTEHWKMFMHMCNIPLVELISKTRATHKNGIRFENWTDHTPDYFHSITRADTITHHNVYGLYNGLIEDGKTITENTSSRGLVENKVSANHPHETVNQFHFDTFALNKYLESLCLLRGIEMIDAEIVKINLKPENGYIESVMLDSLQNITSDFWVDATGMKRALISQVSSAEWNSFSKFLQMDSAIAFPTPPDPSGEIRPYTRARAMKNGWVWEIPTQDRRGNGYVFSSQHCSEDQAISEVSELLGKDIEPAKSIKFNPGHLKEMWKKNCVAVGLCSAFVEPIEASSIGGTIQQMRCLIENMPGYTEGSDCVQRLFNTKMNIMMENICSMISLHYISDRRDSQMWIDQSNMDKPDYLKNLLEIWSYRSPTYNDISMSNYEMFLVPHFYHVAQGQKVLKRENATKIINMFNIRNDVKNAVYDAKLKQSDHHRIDHAKALKEIQI